MYVPNCHGWAPRFNRRTATPQLCQGTSEKRLENREPWQEVGPSFLAL